MSQLSDQQVQQLREVLCSNDGVRILACLMKLFPNRKSGEFVLALAEFGRQDPAHAEELFRMSIQLYANYFSDEHRGGLAAMCGLAQLLDLQERNDDIEQFIDETYPLVIQAAKAIGKDGVDVTNGQRRLRLLKDICSDSFCTPNDIE